MISLQATLFHNPADSGGCQSGWLWFGKNCSDVRDPGVTHKVEMNDKIGLIEWFIFIVALIHDFKV